MDFYFRLKINKHVAPNQVKDATDEDFENIFQRAAFFQTLLKTFLEFTHSRSRYLKMHLTQVQKSGGNFLGRFLFVFQAIFCVGFPINLTEVQNSSGRFYTSRQIKLKMRRMRILKIFFNVLRFFKRF